MSNKTLNLDISKESKINPIIYGRVGDGDSQRITVNTSKRDEQLDLTGYTITFEGVTSGGKTKVFDSDNVVSTSDGLKKGTFDYVFPNMAFAVTGKYERAYFSFIKNDIRDTSGEIEIIVFGNSDIDAPEAETIITEYNKLVAELRALQEQAIEDMNQDFDEITSKIASLQTQITEFDTEVNAVADEVANTVNAALEEFRAGDFYNKAESDILFAEKADLTKANVGLGNVDNYATATQNEAIAGTASNKFITPLGVRQFYDQQAPELASEMLNEIIRRSPQILEMTVADQTITNGTGETTVLSGLRAQINTDPTRFLFDTNKIYISKAGTYTFDLSCSINNKGVGTYFGFQVKQSNGDQSFPGPALKAWTGDKAPVIISGSTNFEAGDQLTIYTYPANAKYEINNLRIRLTYRGDDSV